MAFLVFLCFPERENEHCVRRLIKETRQRQSLADVTAYFVLTISPLPPRRVMQEALLKGYSPLLQLPPGCCPMQRSAAPKNSSVACGLFLCSHTDSPPQIDHFGFLNVTGLTKNQPRVNSQGGDKNRHERSWVRAGRRGNSLPRGFGNAPEAEKFGTFLLHKEKEAVM